MKLRPVIILCLPMMVFALPISANTSSELSSEESTSLQLMREEEKLAYDVYCQMYNLYKDRPFSNISSAEQRHTNAVLGLMKNYKVEDEGNSKPGKFNDQKLQTLYDHLIELGKTSREMAFVVGVIVEETDIADLDASLKATTKSDLTQVFENLRSGSYRHLNAFQSNLKHVSSDPDAAYKMAMDSLKKLTNPAS